MMPGIQTNARKVVIEGMDKGEAARWLAEQATTKMISTDRAHFIEVVETELCSLHAGNIARYRIRPGEFSDWTKQWRRP
jgi:hypothetical protein